MLTIFEEDFQKSHKLHYQLKRIDWSRIDTTPQGRPQPNQVEVSEVQEDHVKPTVATQSTPENPTPVVGSQVRRSSPKRKPPENISSTNSNLKRGKM